MVSLSKLKVGGDGEDKISQLPDALLSHILSFLGTRQVVRTSVLSTRWKYLWTSVPSLSFIHCCCKQQQRSHPHVVFVSFVDRALHCRGLFRIQRFYLRYFCFSEDLSHIDGWIRDVIRRNVVELDLIVRVREDRVEKIELPKTIFLCKTLEVLKLSFNCFIYDPPESGSFPYLKVLHIRLECPDKDFMEKLFTFFPSLEDLVISASLSNDVSGTFKLFVPELKRLTIHFTSNISYEDPYEYYYSINAPKLEDLDLRVDFLPSIVLDNAKSLVKAFLSFSHHDAIKHEHYDDRATTLLASISKIQDLSLSVRSLAASSMPAFENLIRLKLVIHDRHLWEVLPKLLFRTPSLRCFVMDHNKGGCHSSEERYLWHRCSTFYQEYPVLSHLNVISLKDFRGCSAGNDVANYLSKIVETRGKVLE